METKTATEDGIARITRERLRQIEVEGWTLGHDLTYSTPEMLEKAAACYILHSHGLPFKNVPVDSEEPPRGGPLLPSTYVSVPYMWPWNPNGWKPGPTRERDLEKAGALIAASIDLREMLKSQGATADLNPPKGEAGDVGSIQG